MKHLHKNLHVAGQLQVADFARLAEQGVKTIINNRPDGEESGQMSHEDAAKLAQEHGIAYHYLPMANGQPLPEGTVEAFREIVTQTEEPVLAHCRSGMRSSFIWALGAIAAGEVTSDQAVAAGQSAEIPLHNAKSVLDSITPNP